MSENATKEKILKAMYTLTAQYGYDKSSMGKIAEMANIQKPSVYYYFKSKEEIFLEMVRLLYKNELSYTDKILNENQTIEEFKQSIIDLGLNLIEGYSHNKELRKVYAEIDIQTNRISKLAAMAKLQNEKTYDFLNKIVCKGANIGAFNKNCNKQALSQLLYAVLIGIDDSIVYNLPLDSKIVWKECTDRLFK